VYPKFITDAFNDKDVISIDIIFLDFSNAFSFVSHDKLIKKLFEKGISGDFLKILINSLKDRKEFVSYENSNSKIYTINVEIPQGSISSPILFNIYKSDLNNCGKYSKLFEFADDSIIIKIINKIVTEMSYKQILTAVSFRK